LLVWFAWFAVTHPDARVRRTLLWALLLLVLSPSLLIYSKDARNYSLGTSLLGMAGLLWMLRWRTGWRHWSPPGWGEIILFTLATYSHYNAAALVALLLGADAVMATLNRSLVAWRRLLVVGGTFSVWLYLNAHEILITAGGGVSQHSTSGYIVQSIKDASASLHPPWLVFILLLCAALHRSRRWSPARADARALLFLVGLIVSFVAIAGTVAAKSDLASPRYYLYIVPAALVAFSLVLAQLEQRWQMVSAAIVIVALALPGMRSPALNFHEAYREMTEYAVTDTDEDVVYLFPWAPNRDFYRYYLDRLRGEDSRSHMVAVNEEQDVPQVCERLRNVRHVVVVAHASGRRRIDWVYAACGHNWPYREVRVFPTTFSEHWRAAPVYSSHSPAR
jgi:ABC-type iron transport system FetAB permease component